MGEDWKKYQGLLNPPGQEDSLNSPCRLSRAQVAGRSNLVCYNEGKYNRVDIMAPDEKTNLVGDSAKDSVRITFGGTMFDPKSKQEIPRDYSIRIDDPSTGNTHYYEKPHGQYYERHSIENWRK
jgi:hypothetical protein